jgi:UDP-N-acetylglucosamine--N-acetylmuramyl-(pentapeptide) pyrophosphoryl-undecaprenol N-acetylglucosamine transferase
VKQDITGKSVLIIAGGTGGHIFPALAVADLLSSQGVKVSWLGSDIGLEKTLVPQRFPMAIIDARRLRGKGWRAYLTAPWQLLKSTWQAHRIIRSLQPNAALAMGGFVSGPGGLAAKLARVPLVVHEQNAVAGYTNRLLAMFADVAVAAYPGVFSVSSSVTAVGNPVRAEIAAIPAPEVRLKGRQGALRILILGGSQGARVLNQMMAKFAADFSGGDSLEFWHQTGQQDFATIQGRYHQLSVTAKIEPFIENMAAAYEWADLVVCRSGALTVAELTAAGVASILVPFPAAVDDHQWHNARYLEQAGAAKLIREAELSSAWLTPVIENFLRDRGSLLAMAQKARELARPRAAITVAEILVQNMR